VENITHTLSALVLSRAGLGQTKLETATLVIACNLPDADVIAQAVFGLDRAHAFSHRGLTHAVAAAPLEALAAATAAWAIGRFLLKGGNSPWLRLVLLSSVGLAVHLVLDYSNDYGIRLLLPFSAHWFARDLTKLLDFWVLIALILGLLIPRLLNPGGPSPKSTRTASILSLVLLTAYLGFKEVSHRVALATLDSSAQSDVTQRACLPGSLNPLEWTGIVETPGEFRVLTVAVPGRARVRERLEKSCPRHLVEAAGRNREVQLLLSFARFPVFRLRKTRDSGRSSVLVEDLRWQSNKGYNVGPSVLLTFDDQLHLVDERSRSW